ncbi:FAD-dependent oxidoreductase [Streptomyces sp. NPDC047117]|uniref:FAD-dependent oxidoreductase n=1 Tax=Streptomyces sp. NPDC047117 TaxID=3155379 RepID=UPI0033D794AD
MPPPTDSARTPGTWDVIVIGGGPAGATAARVAAENGCATLLLERAAIPRYKTCGGGLIGAALDALPPGLPLKRYDTAGQFTFTLNGRKERTLACASPTCAMVYRSELDAGPDRCRRRGGRRGPGQYRADRPGAAGRHRHGEDQPWRHSPLPSRHRC